MRSRMMQRYYPAISLTAGIAWGMFFCSSTAILAQLYRQTESQSLDSKFQEAMAARDRGDLERAKKLLLALRSRRPGNFAINESLGLVCVAQEQYGDALPLLIEAVHEQPLSDAAHANLGADYFKLQRIKEALVEFTRAATLNPKNPATQQGLGELLLDVGKPAQAAQAFSAALDASPSDAGLQISLVTALVSSHEFDRAQLVLEKFTESDSSAEAQVLLGQVAEGKGNPLEAARHFQRAVDLEPTEEHVWILGVEYLRHWTFDAAISEFKAASERFPASSRVKLALGAAYFGAGKFGEAIPQFARLLDANKDNALYAELLGMACNAVTESAKQQCSSLLAYAHAHPRDSKACTYAASMLLSDIETDHRTDEARVLLMHAIAATPRFPIAQYEMGLLKQEDGDWSGSISNLEAAVKLKQNLAQAHYRLALAYWRAGRKQEAQAQIALQKQYSQQDRQDLDQRLRQITTFLIDAKKQ